MRPMMRVGFRQYAFHLRYRDHWQESNEQQKQRNKNAVGANEGKYVYPGRVIHPPGRRQEIPVKRDNEDYEPFKPHAGVRAHADEINCPDVSTKRSYPEQLRHEHVAGKHRPGSPPVRSEIAIEESEALEGVTSVIGNEKLHDIGVAND